MSLLNIWNAVIKNILMPLCANSFICISSGSLVSLWVTIFLLFCLSGKLTGYLGAGDICTHKHS